MVLRLSANDLAAIAQDDLQSNLSITRQAAEWLTVDDGMDKHCTFSYKGNI